NLFNSTRIATLFLDRQLQIRLFTPALVEIYQLQKSDIGRPLQQFACRLEVPNLLQEAEQVMNSQTVITHEVRSATGQWFQLSISPYLTLQNNIDGVVITFIDITERKKVAALQRLNETRLDLLVTMGQMERHSFNEVSSFMVDSAVKLTSSAFGFVGMLNEAETAIAEHICSDGGQSHCNGSQQPTELSLNDNNLWAKLRHRRKPLWIKNVAGTCPLKGTCPSAPATVRRFLAVPVIDKSRIVAICIVADKASDYEELEAHQLQLLMEGFWTLLQREKARIEVLRAEDASRAKSEFLANMSHEIRTPMTINMMALERVLGSQLNDDQRLTLELANNAAHSLLDLLNDILDFSRIEARKLALRKELFIIQEAVMRVTELFTMKAQEKNIQLSYRIAKDVPEILIGDEKRLRQILLNLIGNAIKFTEQGKITISIVCDKSAHTPPDQQRLLFKIEDTGIGIAKEQQDLLFQSFHQVDNSSTREYGGSGLGLAICKGLTELMGGKIWLQSTLGEGSSFFLSLPFERTEEFDDTAYLLPETWTNVPESATAAEKRPIRVLLAEDDPQLRALEKLALTDKGWEVVEATHGKEVVEVWEKLKIDLILMDLQMPKFDGLMTTRVIRNKEKKRGGHVPIVALTAHALEEDKNKCLAVGMDGFISKPIEIDKLIKIMEKQLQKNLPKRNR
ncbi:MAG TPA: ATP-binding protein, partial [Malonomonas sp.]